MFGTIFLMFFFIFWQLKLAISENLPSQLKVYLPERVTYGLSSNIKSWCFDEQIYRVKKQSYQLPLKHKKGERNNKQKQNMVTSQLPILTPVISCRSNSLGTWDYLYPLVKLIICNQRKLSYKSWGLTRIRFVWKTTFRNPLPRLAVHYATAAVFVLFFGNL